MRWLLLPLLLSLLGCDAAPVAQKPTVPERKAPPPKVVPKVAPKLKVEPPAKVEPKPEPVEMKPPTLAEALALVKAEGEVIRKEFEAELPAKRKLLLPDELAGLDRVLAEKTDSRERFTADDMTQMRKHGMAKWVWANAIAWGCADPKFAEAAKWVWDRSPQARTAGHLLKMAAKWGEMDAVQADALRSALRRVETGGGCTKEERDWIIEFAGEEYFANRPPLKP